MNIPIQHVWENPLEYKGLTLDILILFLFLHFNPLRNNNAFWRLCNIIYLKILRKKNFS